MFQAVGSVLGLASVAFAILVGPITHIHPASSGPSVFYHAHFSHGHSDHPAHHPGDPASFDDGDDDARAVYVNPYIAVAASVGSLVIFLTPVVTAVPPPAVLIELVAISTELGHSPPDFTHRLRRGPPARFTSI